MNGRKICGDISEAGFDCALFLDENSQYYLSDFYTTDGAVIVAKSETALLTDSRYIEAAENDKKAGKTQLSDACTALKTVIPYIHQHLGGLRTDAAVDRCGCVPGCGHRDPGCRKAWRGSCAGMR